jgi:hypothetical protein
MMDGISLAYAMDIMQRSGISNTNPLGRRRRAIAYRPPPPSPPPSSSSSVCPIHRYSHGRQSKFARHSWGAPNDSDVGNRGTAKSATSDSESMPQLSPKPIRLQSFPFFIHSLLHVKLPQDGPVNVRTGLEPYAAADRTCQARVSVR